MCASMCVYVLSAQHPIKLDPRCFDPTVSIQSNCRTTKEDELSNNAPVREKMIPKIVSFVYKNYEAVNQKRIAVCKTCRSKITDGDATTSKLRSTFDVAQRTHTHIGVSYAGDAGDEYPPVFVKIHFAGRVGERETER